MSKPENRKPPTAREFSTTKNMERIATLRKMIANLEEKNTNPELLANLKSQLAGLTQK